MIRSLCEIRVRAARVSRWRPRIPLDCRGSAPAAPEMAIAARCRSLTNTSRAGRIPSVESTPAVVMDARGPAAPVRTETEGGRDPRDSRGFRSPVVVRLFCDGGAGAAVRRRCSPRAYVTRQVADAVSFDAGSVRLRRRPAPGTGGGTVCPQAGGVAARLGAPSTAGLLLSLARGFTQYAAVFVWQDAVESADPGAREAGKTRARRLFLRAKEYGLRGARGGSPRFPRACGQ